MTVVPATGDAVDTPVGVARVLWRRFLADSTIELEVELLPAWPPARLSPLERYRAARPALGRNQPPGPPEEPS